MNFDTSKSLQELENDVWPDTDYPTNLVRKCHELRRVPLRDLSAEDCRLLLGQRIGAPFVVPMALQYLAKNPLEGDLMMRGVLIESVVRLKAPFWEAHQELWWDVHIVLGEVESMRKRLDELALASRDFEALHDWMCGIAPPKK